MKEIRIINGLKLNNKGLLVKDKNNKWVKIHQQQGTLDGACAVYSLMMNLLYLGVISEKDICIREKLDRRTTKGKFLSHFLDNQGLIRYGYSYPALAKEINIFFDNEIFAKRINHKDSDRIIEQIGSCLDNEIPAIISVEYSSDEAHALLAIGKEIDENNVPTKIFCLDPSFNIPSYSPWNCYIDVSSNRDNEYPYWQITEKQNYKVKLGDIIRIDKKEYNI